MTAYSLASSGSLGLFQRADLGIARRPEVLALQIPQCATDSPSPTASRPANSALSFTRNAVRSCSSSGRVHVDNGELLRGSGRIMKSGAPRKKGGRLSPDEIKFQGFVRLGTPSRGTATSLVGPFGTADGRGC